MDFCGPMKQLRSRRKYNVTIIDQFSKYVSLNAVSDQSEKTVAEILRKNWILKFGAS